MSGESSLSALEHLLSLRLEATCGTLAVSSLFVRHINMFQVSWGELGIHILFILESYEED